MPPASPSAAPKADADGSRVAEGVENPPVGRPRIEDDVEGAWLLGNEEEETNGAFRPVAGEQKINSLW